MLHPLGPVRTPRLLPRPPDLHPPSFAAPRAIYTRRALGTTQAFADTAFGGRTYAVDQLSSSIGWVTMLAVIVVASLVGLCLFLSMLRTYQEAARLPHTKCCERWGAVWRGRSVRASGARAWGLRERCGGAVGGGVPQPPRSLALGGFRHRAQALH